MLREDRERLLVVARRDQNRLLRAGGKRCDRALRDDLSLVDDGDLVADLLHLVEEVR